MSKAASTDGGRDPLGVGKAARTRTTLTATRALLG
jgi:hypothetical protein